MTHSTRIAGVARGRGAKAAWAALVRAAAWPARAAGWPAKAAGWPGRVYRARALMHRLSGLDARELRDIGLTPGDLRDASALALDDDPSPTLRRRAEERRRGR